MWQIAHRGHSHRYGDNNMTAFREAVKAGFDMIELDIQLCGSGEIVVFHDICINNKYIAEMPINDLAIMGVLTLEEVLAELSPTDIKLFLDIKGTHYVSYLLVDIIAKWFPGNKAASVFVSGFNRRFVSRIRDANLGVNIGLTTCNTFDAEQMDALTPDCSFVCLDWTALDTHTIDHLHKKGVLVFAYTCSNDFIYRHMTEYRIDGIVTNYFLETLPKPIPPRASN